MSGTDMNTQRLNFEKQFALVLNPHRQILKAFEGADARECEIVPLSILHKLEIPSQPSITIQPQTPSIEIKPKIKIQHKIKLSEIDN